MITKKNKNKNKNKNNKTKKYILTGGNKDLDIIKKELKELGIFSRKLYNESCVTDDNEIKTIYDMNILNNKSHKDLNLEKIIKVHEGKYKYNIKISSPKFHGEISSKSDSTTYDKQTFEEVPNNCILCFNTLINRVGLLPSIHIDEYFSFNKYIKNMGFTEFKKLITHLSGYSNSKNVIHSTKYTGSSKYKYLYNNCFLNTMWYFPGQFYPKTYISTDSDGCEYSKTFMYGNINGKYNKMTPLIKKRINEKGYLNEAINKLILPQKTPLKDNEHNLNIFFLNLCRRVKDQSGNTPRNAIIYYMKYEYYLHQINLTFSKSLLREYKIHSPPKITYGDMPYCLSTSKNFMSPFTILKEYGSREFIQNKNYCYNRDNIFLKKFYEVLCVKIQLIETIYSNELRYFMSLSIKKQNIFIEFLAKNLSKIDYSYFLYIIIYEFELYKWKTYDLSGNDDKLPDYIFELDYIVELRKYLNLLGTQKTPGMNVKNIDYLNDMLMNIPLYSNNNTRGNLFICGDITGATKLYYNTQKYDFFFFFLEIKKELLTNVRKLRFLNIENVSIKLCYLTNKLLDIETLYIKYDNYNRLCNINYDSENLNLFLQQHINLKLIIIINSIITNNIEINFKYNKKLEEIRIVSNKIWSKITLLQPIEPLSVDLKSIIIKNGSIDMEPNKIKLDYLYLCECDLISGKKTDITIKEKGSAIIKNIYFDKDLLHIIPEKDKIISQVIYENVVFCDNLPKFNNNGGSIKELTYNNCALNASQSGIFSLDYNNIYMLIIKNISECETIKMDGKTKLDTVRIENCINLVKIDITNTTPFMRYTIRKLVILNCPKLIIYKSERILQIYHI